MVSISSIVFFCTDYTVVLNYLLFECIHSFFTIGFNTTAVSTNPKPEIVNNRVSLVQYFSLCATFSMLIMALESKLDFNPF